MGKHKNYMMCVQKRVLPFFLLLALLFVFVPFSFVQAGIKRSQKEQLADLKYSIDKIIQQQDSSVHIGVEVISLKNGQKLYQKNANHLFVPASNLKMFTGAAALYYLGGDYKFETQLFTDGSIKNRKLQGNLYIKGSGDPELAVADLESLAFEIKLRGIDVIEGNVVVDNFDFDGISQGPGWMWDEGSEEWASRMDALLVNHSCVEVIVQPADEPAKPPAIFLSPKTDFIVLDNCAKTSEAEDDLNVERAWRTRENRIVIKGQIPLNCAPKRYQVALEDPHLYAGNVYCEQLKKQGIKINGGVVVKPVPKTAALLAVHYSRPLALIIEKMLKVSDNLMADCLFKKIGQVELGSPGTWQRGAQAVRNFLAREVGLDTSELIVLDGCGQSRYNLVSPHQFVQFLCWMQEQFSMSSEFLTALPISGIDGTMQNRLCNPALRARIRAKTGSMTGVSGLSGFVTTKDGEMLAFSLLINGFTKPVEEVRMGIEDQICQCLANFTR